MTGAVCCLDNAPTRIALGDGVAVRTYTADDMPQLVDVVNRNLDHLPPFLPWAQEPVTVEGQTALMTGVAACLVEIAHGSDGVRRVEIKCDVANTRSAAIPQRLGFRLDREELREPRAAGETGHHQVWALDVATTT